MASATLARFFMVFTLLPLITHSIPFVVFHGIGESCIKKAVTRYTYLLSERSNIQGDCIEIGNGEWDSWFMPLEKQVEIACEKVKNMSELSKGYNIVGLSQVKNFVSVAGPHAGLGAIPACDSGLMCYWLKTLMYSKEVQENLAPASYTKMPIDLDAYQKGCKFLPKLNNEFEKNVTYKERFSSLQNLVLIMFNEESVLEPKETSWFGYFANGDSNRILTSYETKLYIEDWIGLRMLDETGRVKFVNVPGKHLEMTDDDMIQHILPYLIDENALEI